MSNGAEDFGTTTLSGGNYEFKASIPNGNIYAGIRYSDGSDISPSDISNFRVIADISSINESLSNYGLDNKFDGVWKQGRINTGSHVDSDIGVYSNIIPCKNNSLVTVNVGIQEGEIGIAWFNGTTFISYQYANDTSKLEKNAPSNATNFIVQLLNSNRISPTTAPSISVYVDNEISNLKNDLTPQRVAISSSFGDGIKCYRVGSLIQIDIDTTIGATSQYDVIASGLPKPFAPVYVTDLNRNTISVENGNLIKAPRSDDYCNCHFMYVTHE